MWLFYTPTMGHVLARMRIVNFSIKPTYTPIRIDRTTKFDTVTRVGRGVFLVAAAMPHPIRVQFQLRISATDSLTDIDFSNN